MADQVPVGNNFFSSDSASCVQKVSPFYNC